MSEITPAQVKGLISRAVYKHWNGKLTSGENLSRTDLIADLQQLFDDNIERALRQAYDAGCHDTIKKMEDDLP